MRHQRWQDWTMVFIGLWVSTSPWALPLMDSGAMSQTPMVLNALISGAILTVIGIIALIRQAPWQERVDFLLAAWLFGSPWFVNYVDNSAASWNAWICAALIFALSGSEIVQGQGERQA